MRHEVRLFRTKDSKADSPLPQTATGPAVWEEFTQAESSARRNGWPPARADRLEKDTPGPPDGQPWRSSRRDSVAEIVGRRHRPQSMSRARARRPGLARALCLPKGQPRPPAPPARGGPRSHPEIPRLAQLLIESLGSTPPAAATETTSLSPRSQAADSLERAIRRPAGGRGWPPAARRCRCGRRAGRAYTAGSRRGSTCGCSRGRRRCRGSRGRRCRGRRRRRGSRASAP